MTESRTPPASFKRTSLILDPNDCGVIMVLRGSTINADLCKTAGIVWERHIISDIVLELRTGEQFKAHKFVLLSRSKYLRGKILNAALAEPTEAGDCIKDIEVDPDSFEKVLEFMYTNCVSTSKDRLEALADAAKKLGVKELYRICLNAQFADDEATPDNCLKLWRLAHEISDLKLAGRARPVALKHFVLLQHSQDLKALPGACMKEYLGHKDLSARSTEEKVNAAIAWAQVDIKERSADLCGILDVLPLRQVDVWFLDHILHNSIIKESPDAKCRVYEARNGERDKGVLKLYIGKTESGEKSPEHDKTLLIKQKDDKGGLQSQSSPEELPVKKMTESKSPTKVPIAPQPAHTEINNKMVSLPRKPRGKATTVKCWIAVGLGKEGGVSNEVWAVRMEKDGFNVVSLGHLEADFAHVWTSCCVSDNILYASGLGKDRDELWAFDLGDRSSKLCGRLTVPRHRHTMAAGNEGCIYIMGGKNPSTHQFVKQVEMLKQTSNTIEWAGNLSNCQCNAVVDHDVLRNVRCAKVNNENQMFLYGVNRHKELNVYETTTFKTIAHCFGPSVTCQSHIYGVVKVQDYILVVTREYTAKMSIKEMSRRKEYPYVKLQRYITPNYDCSVTLSPDGTHVLLLGGWPRIKTTNAEFVYKAPVEELLSDKGQGWEPTHTPWPIGECEVYGYDVADVDFYDN